MARISYTKAKQHQKKVNRNHYTTPQLSSGEADVLEAITIRGLFADKVTVSEKTFDFPSIREGVSPLAVGDVGPPLAIVDAVVGIIHHPFAVGQAIDKLTDILFTLW